MPRKQIKVEKWKKYRTREVLVKAYSSIVLAFRSEKVGYTTLMAAIREKTLLNGHYFRRQEHRPRERPAKKRSRPRPPSFKGPGETFSIEKWGKEMKKYLP